MSSPEHDQPTLVLTRPRRGAERLLAEVESKFAGPVRAILSPMMDIRPVSDWPDLSLNEVLIVTSPYAVQGNLAGQLAYCVGQRTAEAVLSHGGRVAVTAPDVSHLLPHLIGTDEQNFTYLRGTHVAADLARNLAERGISCREHVTYDQQALAISQEARRAIEGEFPVILPLFSNRSARLIGDSISLLGSRLHVIAMSAGISETWRVTTGGSTDVAAAPSGAVMVSMIVAALRRNLP